MNNKEKRPSKRNSMKENKKFPYKTKVNKQNHKEETTKSLVKE